jgi:AraC-like DNA-binding protein
MLLKKYFSIVFVLIYISCNSQNIDLNKDLLKVEVYKIYKNKPIEALKYVSILLKQTTSNTEKVDLILLNVNIYTILGDYKNAAIHLFELNKYDKYISDEKKIIIFLEKAQLFNQLKLYDQSQKYLENSEIICKNIEYSKKNNLYSKIIIEKINSFIIKQEFKKAKDYYLKNKDFLEINILKDQELFKKYHLSLLKLHINLLDYKLANIHFNKLEKYLENKKNDAYFMIKFFIESSNFSFVNKNYTKSLSDVSKAQELLDTMDNIYFREKLSKIKALNYLALNQENDYKQNYATLIITTQELENIEQEVVNSLYNLTDKNNDLIYKNEQNNNNFKIIILSIVFIIICLICFIIWYFHYSKHKKYKEIISFLEITRNNKTPIIEEFKNNKKQSSIIESTEKEILLKLKKFENSKKFLKKDMSLSMLSSQLDINSKYISETINKHYQCNFNTYINQLRINFIIEKLKTDAAFVNYKISYLAEYSGFSSHSSFSIIFKNITGLMPNTFIELLKKDPKFNLNNHENS